LLNHIKNEDNIYAHVKKPRKELLKEHIELSHKYFEKILKDSDFKNVIKNLEEKIVKDYSMDFKKIWNEMIIDTVLFHDFGKINPNFQHNKMDNANINKVDGTSDSKHSLLSSVLYVDYYFPKIREFSKTNVDEAFKLILFMYINSYIISKHHGALGKFADFKNEIMKKIDELGTPKRKDLLRYFDKKIKITSEDIEKTFIQNIEEDSVEKEWDSNIYYYIYSKILFSLLVACDYYSTYEFMNIQKVDDFGNEIDVDELMREFKSTKVYEGIENYSKTHSDVKNINDLRSEMFLEAQGNFIENFSHNIFYLEAPTGSGKTITSINLFLKALEKDKNTKKIFYIFPFNTLVEQTNDSILKCFGKGVEKDVAVINSITPIKYVDESEDNNIRLERLKSKTINYEEMLLDRQFLHYPIVLTTHVSFFNILFGTLRESVFPLVHLANSVIILDEIQSYKNDIWIEIIGFLKSYAEILNLKIIIMSATLPKLDELLNVRVSSQNLINNRDKYFKNKLFKDRVVPNFSLLNINDREETFCAIENLVKNEYGNSNVDILIEFITKKSAREFYRRLKDQNLDKEVLILTGDDSRYKRNKLIEKIKNRYRKKNIILIATQVVEAGVDMDFHIGFKNISILDAEEQFIGRINRSCSRSSGIVYFFKLDKNVHKKDVRCDPDFLLTDENMQKIFIEKDFDVFYSNYVIKALKRFKNKQNLSGLKYNIKSYLTTLNFIEVEKLMELISEDKNKCSVFFDREVETDNDGTLNGSDVWKDFKDLLLDHKIGYAEKRVKLSQVQAKMDYFIYTVNKDNFPYEDAVGDIFYFGKGDEYFDNGEFDTDKFEKDIFVNL